MTKDQAVRMLVNSKTLKEYNAVLDLVKAENGEEYPDWYWPAVVLSGLSQTKATQFAADVGETTAALTNLAVKGVGDGGQD